MMALHKNDQNSKKETTYLRESNRQKEEVNSEKGKKKKSFGGKTSQNTQSINNRKGMDENKSKIEIKIKMRRIP